MNKQPLLSVRNISLDFPIHKGLFYRKVGAVHAVKNVSFQLEKGKTLGIVGESGCGKSSLAKLLVNLYQPSRGEMIFHGKDLKKISRRERKLYRPKIQMVFQDPASSLNAKMTIGQLIAEPLYVNKIGTPIQRREKVMQLLERVGLSKSICDRFSFEFSGGQRQRMSIARAIILKPELLILDEPVSALDVSVQSQVINLLLELQEEMALSYLFIAHDLSVVRHVSDDVAVMYLGEIVEQAPTMQLYQRPRHAYTKSLIDALPVADPTIQQLPKALPGEVPSPLSVFQGSPFGYRINHPLYDQSKGQPRPLVEITDNHYVAADMCCLTAEDYQQVQAKI